MPETPYDVVKDLADTLGDIQHLVVVVYRNSGQIDIETTTAAPPLLAYAGLLLQSVSLDRSRPARAQVMPDGQTIANPPEAA